MKRCAKRRNKQVTEMLKGLGIKVEEKKISDLKQGEEGFKKIKNGIYIISKENPFW